MLAHPIMVLDSTTEPGSFIVLTSETHKGKPVIITIKPNGMVEQIRPVNVLTSAYNKETEIITRWILGGKLLASDKEKALAWISTVGLKLSSRTPEVTVAPASNRTGRGSSILEQLKAAIRKSLPISVPKDDDGVNLSRSSPTDDAGPAFSRQSQTDTPAFKKWFGKSKVVDENGQPLVVYHGTTADFSEFAPETGWFTVDPVEANMFGGFNSAGSNVMPAYVNLQKPRILDGDKIDNWRSAVFDALTDGSVGGVIVTRDGKPVWVVAAEPAQIKSATGNGGEFDGSNADIMFSRTETATFAHHSTSATFGTPLLILLMVHSATA